jgi:hypothetical protein
VRTPCIDVRTPRICVRRASQVWQPVSGCASRGGRRLVQARQSSAVRRRASFALRRRSHSARVSRGCAGRDRDNMIMQNSESIVSVDVVWSRKRETLVV